MVREGEGEPAGGGGEEKAEEESASRAAWGEMMDVEERRFIARDSGRAGERAGLLACLPAMWME